MVRQRILTALFDRLYTTGARFYDPLTIVLFGSFWREWQRAVRPHIHGDRLLDLGCGTGALLAELFKDAGIIVGVDRSAPMVRIAARRLCAHPVSVVQADARALPFRAGAFSTVISTFPSAFIVDPQVHAEIARVLEPGGRLVVVLSGTIDRWPLWRRPLRLVFRLVYGSMHGEGQRPTSPLVGDPFCGEWREEQTGHGRALLWIAVRR